MDASANLTLQSLTDCSTGDDPLATSATLINDLRSGSSAAWWRMVERYSGLIFAWTRHAGLQDADSADILQDVFLAVHRGLKDFELRLHPRAFRGWLWTITKRKIADLMRRKGTDATLPPSVVDALADEPVLIRTGVTAERGVSVRLVGFLKEVLEIRQEFAPQTWQAFWRTAVDEQPAATVADELGMSPGAVRVARHRVLKRVRSACTPVRMRE